jgi:hypothetical protein
MITNSKLALVLAVATVALASPAFAQSSGAPSNWNSSARSQAPGRNAVDNPNLTGGGSNGYNQDMRTDY